MLLPTQNNMAYLTPRSKQKWFPQIQGRIWNVSAAMAYRKERKGQSQPQGDPPLVRSWLITLNICRPRDAVSAAPANGKTKRIDPVRGGGEREVTDSGSFIHQRYEALKRAPQTSTHTQMPSALRNGNIFPGLAQTLFLLLLAEPVNFGLVLLCAVWEIFTQCTITLFFSDSSADGIITI